ncbi:MULTISPECIES: recombinase family protein [unclassified Duganella]|uniref:recombinase family protein n=1 Tax=unclassified Duganella TaxID=2636909 RepID=UPI00087E733F|nr:MULTISPECIES: recombinase family protein [unclassified Duganella]SDF81001.1 Site-specific DNA recombinase [Duganella sp. OV458]SDI48382.1 Site-specific DNA recombinase [Duganella sp. OV510]
MANKTNQGPAGTRVRQGVALYMRMSTDGQIGSIPTQRIALTAYARRHRMEIVKEYTDSGKSGLTIKQRKGLLSLIHDVTSGAGVPFQAVLVYDVTRWGRFQDPDESAHYEFICKNAGIKILYVAEQFNNDDSLASLILKTVSRVRAAEDSREKSAKVVAGQARLARQGFKQGGPAGYGLRRVSLEKNGNVRRELANGERKSALTDRVALVLGPEHEIAVVRRIYDWYLAGDLQDAAISRALNAEAIPTEYGLGRTWTAPIVHRILTSEKYIGTAIYNRTTQRMQTVAVRTPESSWIRKRNAFPALIDVATFQRAQELRRCRGRGIPTEVLLDMLRMLYRENGKVSTDLINQDPRVPSATTFTNRFQSLTKAYFLAGVAPHPRGVRHVEKYRKTEAVRSRIFLEICECVVAANVSLEPGHSRNTFVLNGRIQAQVIVSRAERFNRSAKVNRWCFPIDKRLGTQFLIAVQLEPDDTGVRAVYLFDLASIDVPVLLMREERPDEFIDNHYPDLAAIFGY